MMEKVNFEDDIMNKIDQIEPKKIEPLGMNLNAFALMIFGGFGLLIILSILPSIEWSDIQFNLFKFEDFSSSLSLTNSIFIIALLIVVFAISTALSNLLSQASKN